MALTLTPSPTANPQPSSSLPTSSLPGTALEVFPEEMPESHDHPVDAPAEPDAALAEVAGSGSSVTDVPSPSGIPQSSTAPEVLTGHLDAQEMRRKAEQEEKERKWAQWRANAQAKVFAVVLGDENARRGIDTSFDEDQPRAWRTVAVDSYLKVFTHGQPPADTPLGRDLLRFQVAHRMFNGRGADSDEEFHAELAKAAQAFKKRRAEDGDRAAQARRFFKARRVYGPEAGGEGEKSLAALERYAREAGVFVQLPWTEQIKDFTGWNERGQEERQGIYESVREEVAEKYRLTTGEIDDVVKHRLGTQEKAISRDALGQIHIKDEVFYKGLPEIRKAITQSDLTPWEKEEELRTLPERFERFKAAVVKRVIERHPEFAANFLIHEKLSLDENYQTIIDNVLTGKFETEATSMLSMGLDSASLVMRGLDAMDEAGRVPDGFPRDLFYQNQAEELANGKRLYQSQIALSNEIHGEKLRIFGATGGTIGAGLWSVAETAMLAAVTGPLAPEISLAKYGRLATMFNAGSKVAPVAATMAARQGVTTYEQAVRMNIPEEEATRLGWYAGLIEGVTTVAFSAIGAGGVESIASGASREALRESLRGSVRSAWKEGGKAFAKGVLGELGEEELITLLDTAAVQTTLRPGMTAEDIKRAVYETAVVTLIGSGGFAAGHGKHAFDDTIENNLGIAGEIGGIETGAKPRPKVEITAERQAQVTEAYYQKALSSRVANTDDVRSLIPGYNEADPLTRDADYHKAASAINDAIIDRLLAGMPNGKRVIVLAGGAGSGKTDASGINDGNIPKDFAIDTVLGWDGAMEDLDSRIENSGREATFIYVYTHFDKALPRVIERFLDKKSDPRLVPLSAVVDGHIGAQQNILNASEKFVIQIIDNSGDRGEQRTIDKSELRKYDYLSEGREEIGPREGGGRDRPDHDRQHQPPSGGEGTESARERARARLLAEGHEILQRYQREGKLTQREVDAFLQEGEFTPKKRDQK